MNALEQIREAWSGAGLPLAVPIRGSLGWHGVPCVWRQGGLAVTRAAHVTYKKYRADLEEGFLDARAGPLWSITHEKSGLKLPGTWWSWQEAQAWAVRLLPLADWTQDAAALKEAVRGSAELREFYTALRCQSQWEDPASESAAIAARLRGPGCTAACDWDEGGSFAHARGCPTLLPGEVRHG